jgi:hypothetical protein
MSRGERQHEEEIHVRVDRRRLGIGQPSSPTQPAEPVVVPQCPDPPGCPPFAAG